MKTITLKALCFAVAAAGAGLWAAAAGAVSCPAYGGQAYTVTTSPDAACHDYGKGNVGNAGGWEVDDVVTPPPDPSGVSIPPNKGDTLQVPTGYSLLDDTDATGDLLDGVLKIDMATGTFKIWAAGPYPFLLVLKQADTWAAFMLPAGVTSGTYSVNGKYGLSHAVLFGGEDSYQVPIPAAAWLLGSGLLGLLGIGRRRRSPVAA